MQKGAFGHSKGTFNKAYNAPCESADMPINNKKERVFNRKGEHPSAGVETLIQEENSNLT